MTPQELNEQIAWGKKKEGAIGQLASALEASIAREAKLRGALEHIQGMAGNPDPADGCRLIIERARAALKSCGVSE